MSRSVLLAHLTAIGVILLLLFPALDPTDWLKAILVALTFVALALEPTPKPVRA